MAKTIVLFSTKGGVGKTLVASNLAVALAKDFEKRVCLLD
ncbi:MAG: ParA family protein, partial [Candidatus Omnitrophota bacterium]